jgi:hypothetical protein
VSVWIVIIAKDARPVNDVYLTPLFASQKYTQPVLIRLRAKEKITADRGNQSVC